MNRRQHDRLRSRPQRHFSPKCIEWRNDPWINPETGRNIKIDGPMYQKLRAECGEPTLGKVHGRLKSPGRPKSPKLQGKCTEWLKDPGINPETQRKIKIDGPTYHRLRNECGDPKGYPGGRLRSRSVPKVQSRNKPQGRQRGRSHDRLSSKCIEWRNDPSVNPATKKKIKIDGPTYHKLRNECGDPIGSPGEHPQRRPAQPKDGNYTLADRIAKGLRINNDIREITTDQWKMCMTGSSSAVFQANFSNVIEIGRGSFGQVYKVTTRKHNDQFVIKEANLNPIENDAITKATARNQKWEAIDKNAYPEEYRILDLVNQLVVSRKCPNFLSIYNMALCNGCKVERLFQKRKTPEVGSCFLTFMEAASSDLAHADLKSYEQQLSILYQLLIAVYAVHRYYAIWHTDIKAENVLIQQVKAEGYFEYVIDDKSYFIKNTGVVAYLADFGVAHILSPLYTRVSYFGIRNAEVMRSNEVVRGSHLYWKPIFKDHQPVIKWRDINNKLVKGTKNLINADTINIPSSVPIDLNNSQKFPPFDFFHDIQDVIRIFTGEKQALQPGKHQVLRNLSLKLVQMLVANQCSIRSFVPHIHGTVKYILANEMLDQLYIKPRSIDLVVDRFVM